MPRIRFRVVVPVAVIAVGLALGGANAAMAHWSPPIEAVFAQASECGWEREDLSTLGAGYSSNLLSWSAYGRFRTDDEAELYLAIERPHPFSGWRLAEMRLTR